MSVAEKPQQYDAPAPKKILGRDLRRSDVSRPSYRVLLQDNSITPQDVLRPEFFANVAEMFTKDSWPYAIVEIIWSDSSKFMEIIVISATRVTAKTHVLRFVDFEKQQENFDGMIYYSNSDAKDHKSYEILWKGSIDKHVIIRLSDKEKLAEGISTKAMANAWLDDYISKL